MAIFFGANGYLLSEVSVVHTIRPSFHVFLSGAVSALTALGSALSGRFGRELPGLRGFAVSALNAPLGTRAPGSSGRIFGIRQAVTQSL